MKLDKVEDKKSNKKTIIICVLIVIIVISCSMIGYSFLENKNNKIRPQSKDNTKSEFTQNVIVGQETNESYSALTDLQAIFLKPYLDICTKITNESTPEDIMKLEKYLNKAGFGYSAENVDYLRKSVEDIEKWDKENKIAPAEKIYMLMTGIEDKPEYLGEKPEVESITDVDEEGLYAEAWFSYKGEKVTSGKVRTILPGVVDITLPAVGIADVATLKLRAEESISEQFGKALEEYYSGWGEYCAKRNDWLEMRESLGIFEAQEPNNDCDYYTLFYTYVANKILLETDLEEWNKAAVDQITDILYNQIWDEDGNERESRNLLKMYVNGEKFEIYNKPEEGENKPSGGNSSGDNNSSGGNSSGDNSSSGGNSSGGSSSGGSSSGGNSSSGENMSGGTLPGNNNSSEEKNPKPEEPEDKVAPSIVKASIISPASGIYNKGQEIKIKVEFDKKVYGAYKKVDINKSTAPKLLIRFGDEGENKLATFDSVSGKAIIYSYTIDKADQGKLQMGKGDNYIGSVYNVSGYKADLKNIGKLEEDKIVEVDNIAPKVEKIEAISNGGEYKTEDEIKIKVTFNEKIYTSKRRIPLIKETAPNLNIYFGERKIKNPVVSEINNDGNYIIYSYKITKEDKGILKVDEKNAFDGTKKIYDQVGNEAILVEGKELTGNQIIANSNLAQIALDKKEITLDLKGAKTAVIKATVTPNATTLNWKSSDEKVATIDGTTGTVTALAIGETMITVTAEDGAEESCKVIVKDTTAGETKVQLNQNKLELDLNKTKTTKLIATVTPVSLAIDWSSTNEEVVTVNEMGEVTAIQKGEASIVAKAKDGTTATCEVKVINTNANEIEPTSIELNLQNVKVISGKTGEIQLKTRVTPSNSNTNQQIQYESSDDAIASIDEAGKVTIKGKGVAVITATSGNGQKSYCSIEVAEVTEDSELKDKISGDINQDNKVDTTDLLAMLRHIAAASSSQIAEKHQDWILTDNEYLLADVNLNGIVDVTDTLKLLRHIAAEKSKIIKEKHEDWMIITDWK